MRNAIVLGVQHPYVDIIQCLIFQPKNLFELSILTFVWEVHLNKLGNILYQYIVEVATVNHIKNLQN